MSYGIGYAEGKCYTDRVCLDKNATRCSYKYKLVGIEKTRALKNLRCSGLVGMSPQPYMDQNSLFIDEMTRAGAIKQRIFSFYITDYFKSLRDKGIGFRKQDGTIAKGSRIVIGGYDL